MTIWDELWKEGNRPRSVHELIMIGNDWLMNVKAEGDKLQEKAEEWKAYKKDYPWYFEDDKDD